MAKSVWDDLEEVQNNAEFGNAPQVQQSKSYKSVWDNLEEVPVANQSTDEFQPNFEEGQQNQFYDAAKGLLQGGVKYSKQFANDFGGALNNPVQNPNVAQGLGNIARDLGGFATGLVQGVPQFLGDLKNQAITTGSTIKNNPSSLIDVLPAVGHGVDKAISDIAGGLANLPEAVAASYKGREYNPKFKSVAPVEGTADLVTDLMFEKGLISEEQYKNYIKHKIDSRNRQSQLALAGTIGEFLPAMLPIGKAAGLGKTAQTVENLNKAQKIAKTAGEIAKGSAVGAGYGFVANPEGSLAERSQSAGAGASAGAMLGAGGKVVKAGAKAAEPHIYNATKNVAYSAGKGARTILDVSAEIKDRLNSNNYETVLDAQPVERGEGLSRRTVYEAKQKRVYKRPNSVKDINKGEVPKIGTKNTGTDFVIGEGSELKTPSRPSRVQRLLTDSGENVTEKGGVLNNSVRSEQKEKAKKDVIDRIKKLAPNTAEKLEAETKTVNPSELSTESQFVKDNDGNVYETNKDGSIRNVDTDEYSTSDVNTTYTKYVPAESEYIKKQAFKYDPNAKGDTNAHNYAMSQDDVVKAYNDYVKNPTVENREVYQDTYGARTEEYLQKENNFKKDNSIAKIAPKTVEKIQKNNTIEQSSNNSDVNKETDNHSEQASEMVNIAAKSTNKPILKYNTNDKTYITVTDPDTNITYHTNGDVIYRSDYVQNKHTKNKEPQKVDSMNAQVNTLISRAENNNRKLQDIGKEFSFKSDGKSKESEVKNESTATNERRQVVSEKNEETAARVERTKNEQSRTGEVLRGDGQQELQQSSVSNGRGISSKDKEIIEKEYKNQHELNKAIEEYINNEEYRKYAGSVSMPQEVKDWLKKYSGAGGLEKQGAEGKGLLSEYYTPKNIVDKMWDLTAQYIDVKGAKVLEPSAGIGRFLENSEHGKNFDVVEMNPVSAKITKILYPNANVTTGEFQERFVDKTNNRAVKNVTPEYDIVIGNPPYGDYNGVYKSIEGKNYKRLEAYFINRGLDTLKDNGIMTFIVPSSFLSGKSGKLEIANKCKLLDAYRLPNNTFDTTSIGTDIIVLRKKTGGVTETNLFSDKWFEKYPEKILGEVEKGKGQWGSDIVKGDKNAVDSIDTSKKDIQETSATKIIKKVAPKTVAKNTNKTRATVKENSTVQKGKVEYETYKHDIQMNDIDYETFKDTRIDGTLPKDKYKPNDKISQYGGELYNDFNYLQGDIYEKLDRLQYESISDAQREIQRKKLESVLPTPKEAKEIRFNPTSDFIQEFDLDKVEEPRWGNKRSPLVEGFIDYLEQIPSEGWRDDFGSHNMRAYLNGERVKFNINFEAKSPEYKREYSKKLSKLKNTVEKHFGNYVEKALDKDVKERLVEDWNKHFNCIYNPDYTKMPLLVKDLNAKFKGKDLKLKETQIEGINFLANKGVGLIGFEVGVGKTLTGIISTVQNMQMGRCKKPLIVIPKNLKKNWKEEFSETFPNIKVVDVDNLSKWNGEIEEGTVTLATYQALDNIWYDKTNDELTDIIYAVGNNFGKEITKRGKEATKERYAKMVGKALEGNKAKYTLEQLGFDHVTFDEAHAGKNLFEEARADSQEKTASGASKGTNSYFNMRGGRQSKTALRMFLLTQHILNANNNRNVFMLTATPFNNQSLEVFNMLSYLAKDKLDKMGLYNVYQFNENFIDVTSDIVLDANNNPVEKQVELGFKNAGALREIINSVMLIRTADEAGVVRPSKSVTRQKLDPTNDQLALFDEADEIAMNKDIEGALFKSLSLRRTASISPDIAQNNYNVSPEDFIKNSPKLSYIMRCVETMKNKDSKTSQLMYMPIGVKYLDKIKQYLVNKGVYKDNEIAIISAESALSNPEKEEARISKITDSFNDREGDIKLIIGTQKIQVGMNLNKNTSTLYMPFVEWNPTDYVQTVGRMWRQGNVYKNVRVVVPLLKNSSDSFMFQKLDEKIKRLNDLMGSEKEYIENADLETEEEKIAMISNPVKRAKMFTLLQKDKINFEIKKLEARKRVVADYQEKIERYNRDIKYYEKEIAELEELKEKNGELNGWKQESLQNNKKVLAILKKGLGNINAQIEFNNIDFKGKDSAENIDAKIEEYNKEIEKLNDLEQQKIEEYSAEYEEERRNPKSIDELVKDFADETDKYYNNFEGNEDFEIPIISGLVKKIKDYPAMRKAINSGETIQELINSEPLFKMLENEFSDVSEYTIAKMPKNLQRPNLYGLHHSNMKTIFMNMDSIGDNKERFINTLRHEVEHAKQYNKYEKLLKDKGIKNNELMPFRKLAEENNKNIPLRTIIKQNEIKIQKLTRKYNLSFDEIQQLKDFHELRVVNIQKTEYNNKHKELLDEYLNKSKNLTGEELTEYFNTFSDKNKKIIKEYKRLFYNYKNSKYETNARTIGEILAKELINNDNNDNRRINGTTRVREQWNVRTRPQHSSSSINKRRSISEFGKSQERSSETYEASEEEIKIPDEYGSQNNEIKEKGLDKVYKWHGDIGKDRFDVDKKLNSFIQVTKGISKEYSRKLGMKVNDKMVREILPFLRERTGLPEKLNRPDLEKFFNKLTGADKERLTKLADDVSSFFDKYYKNYQEAKGVIDAEGIENHISHIWDLDKKKKPMMTNYFTTSSRFAKTRTFDTLVRGIDGFEINGEIVQFKPKTLDYAEILKSSSDNLIKATHDSILAEELKGLEYDGTPLIMARTKAPSDWVEISHPALNKVVYAGTTANNDTILRKESVKVHPAIAPQLSAIFEMQKPDSNFWKGYDTINGLLKQSTLGFSGFHGYALTESAAGNIGLKNTFSELNIKKIYDSIKNGNYEVFNNEEIVKQALDDGLEIGTPQSDMNRSQVETFLGKIPKIGRFLQGAVETNNKVLWDCLHTMYKVRAYEFLVNNAGGLDNTTKAQRRVFAQWVNDSFGGQSWELLGIKRSTVKVAGRVLLSPDWNYSAIRQTMGLFDGKTLDNIVSGKDTKFWEDVKKIAENLGAKGAEGTNYARGRSARAFFLRTIIYSATIYNLINAYFRNKDRKEHPNLYPKNMRPIDYTIWANSLPNDKLFDKVFPYVFLGRNKDGSARYLRVGKQFREVPEMLSDPVDKFGGKSASIINAICQTGLGYSPADVLKRMGGEDENIYYNQNIWKGYGKYRTRKTGMELYKGMGKTALKSAEPFVMNKALDEKHDTSAWDLFAQTSRGLTYGKTMKAFNQAYVKNQGKDVFQKIGNRAYQDGMSAGDIEKARKSAQQKYRTNNSLEYKHDYVEAMENQDKVKVQQITNSMKKRGLPIEEQKRIYEVAYKEYLKKRRGK